MVNQYHYYSHFKNKISLLKGLSEERAAVILERDGPNDLTPARTTPEIVRLAKNMFGGFAMLLWIGAFLCFVAHFLELYTLEDPQYDNVCYFHLNLFI
jgi:sodium/potassium-transporting ATPase subunit alpha